MNRNNNVFALIVLIIVIIAVGLYFYFTRTKTTLQNPLGSATSSVDGSVASTTEGNNSGASSSMQTIHLAVLDTDGKTNGKQRGCDRVVMIPQQIPETSGVLTAAMNELFSLNDLHVNGWYNFISQTNDTLHFDHATVTNGTANIYLTGQLTGLSGVCDDPRASIQIEETALQFPTVSDVQIYLNGSSTDLVPSEKGV